MSKIMSNIIDGLHGEVGQYGRLYESESKVNEDKRKTMHGDGDIVEGGPESICKKVSKSEVSKTK